MIEKRGVDTRPLPRFVPDRDQRPEHELWLREPQAGVRPTWTYDPDRRAGDIVPEVVKVMLSEMRPTMREGAPASGAKHRAPRRPRWWPWATRSSMVA